MNEPLCVAFESHTDCSFCKQMYTGGKLLFADHIFNGYGNAKKDFLKQVSDRMFVAPRLRAGRLTHQGRGKSRDLHV